MEKTKRFIDRSCIHCFHIANMNMDSRRIQLQIFYHWAQQRFSHDWVVVKNSHATFQDIIKASKHLNALKIRGNSVYVRKFMWIWVTQELKLWGLDGTHCCPQQPSVVLKSKNTTELKSLSECLYPACVWYNHRERIFAAIFTCFWLLSMSLSLPFLEVLTTKP